MSEPSPLPIPAASLPAHIAIIMDGNGRWAQERGLSRSEGHKAGVRAAKAIVTECRTLGIRHLTLYTFSQENWGRPKDEVSLLFQLLVSFLGEELPSMERNGISLRVFGDLDGLPLPARTALRHAMNRTAKCSRHDRQSCPQLFGAGRNPPGRAPAHATGRQAGSGDGRDVPLMPVFRGAAGP